MEENEPAVAGKVVLLLPAATVTEEGTIRVVEAELNETAVPPEGAPPLRVTVQVDDDPGISDPGLHVTELGTIGAISAIEVLAEEPFSVAVMVSV